MEHPRLTCRSTPIPKVSTSPLLRLPAELRNYIYELVLGGNLIHAECRPRTARCKPRTFKKAALDELGSKQDLLAEHTKANSPHCLHYYLCKSPLSEDVAYHRSQDSSLNEQLHGEADWTSNYWRMGDDFHIDSCSKRHEDCYPHQFATARAHINLTIDDLPPTVQDVQLSDVLSLNFLQTCSQIYREAKDIPLTHNTFGFRLHSDATCFLFLLDCQSNLLRSICVTWQLNNYGPVTICDMWGRWLSEPAVVSRLRGLRVLHLSLSISHDLNTQRCVPPKEELFQQGLHTIGNFFVRARKLSLEHVTVILSQERASQFGDLGCPLLEFPFESPEWLRGLFDGWMARREHACLRASEKRDLAERLRRYLLKLDPKKDSTTSPGSPPS